MLKNLPVASFQQMKFEVLLPIDCTLQLWREEPGQIYKNGDRLFSVARVIFPKGFLAKIRYFHKHNKLL